MITLYNNKSPFLFNSRFKLDRMPAILELPTVILPKKLAKIHNDGEPCSTTPNLALVTVLGRRSK